MGIARAIVTDPTLLLCDEPTGDLDRKARATKSWTCCTRSTAEQGKTIIMVTHDIQLAADTGLAHAAPGQGPARGPSP